MTKQTTVSFSNQVPATNDIAGYESLTYTEIKHSKTKKVPSAYNYNIDWSMCTAGGPKQNNGKMEK